MVEIPSALLLDSFLAYLHIASIMLSIMFLGAELMLLRSDLGRRTIESLARADMGFFLSACAVAVTGLLLLGLSSRGFLFYAGNFVLWLKVLLFVTAGTLTLVQSRRYSRWRHMENMDSAYVIPEREAAATRTYLYLELGLLSVMPLLGAFVARGVGR